MRLDELPRDALQHMTTFLNCHKTLVAMSLTSEALSVAAEYDPAWEGLCRLALEEEEYARQREEVESGMDWCGWKTVYSMRHQAAVMQKVVTFIRTTLIGGAQKKIDKKALSSLINLDLSRTCIGKDGAVKLAIALQGNYVLEKLDVSNQMMSEGINPLVDVILTMKKLRYVNLSGNRLGPDGAVGLRRLIDSNRLSRLDACDNFLGARGARTLSDAALKKPFSLCLSLDNNDFRDEGLAHILRIAPKLSSLSLRCNRITSVGVDPAVEFLKAAPRSFVTLDLSNDPPAGGSGAGGAAAAAKSANVIKSSAAQRLRDACERKVPDKHAGKAGGTVVPTDSSGEGGDTQGARLRTPHAQPRVILSAGKKGSDSGSCSLS
eukprot:TRINITY_DN32778_c0_g1_i1.p1 TRINITY_DN32778_c0_g1~~TRINITY_DN32778_c0_g1_i1.p1  ORF type:complete len:378 (+),score=129.07 TRINITY_DN32778_c0_g1_i1:245-1378(+)